MGFDAPHPDPGAAPPPRFCPRCRRPGPDLGTSPLCPECGEATAAQGHCGVCGRFWRLPVGAACPKHDLPLDAGPPAPALPTPTLPGGGPAWVTVGTFAHPLAAEAPRLRLEAEGIPTFLDGERMGTHGIYQVATGGVRLQVPAPLLPDARILLAQSWAALPLDEDLDDAWDDLAPEPGATRRALMRGLIVVFLLLPILQALAALLFRR